MPDLQFRCKCGALCRIIIHVPGSGASVEEFVRHCDQGGVEPLPGKPIMFLENKGGEWKRIHRW